MLAMPLAAEWGLEIIFLQNTESFDSAKDRQTASARMYAEFQGYMHNLNTSNCGPENHMWNLLKGHDAHAVLTALMTCRMARNGTFRIALQGA